MRVFISQPMRGKTDEEIKTERAAAVALIRERFPNTRLSIMDSFFEGAPVDEKPLYYLGCSFQILSRADVAVFLSGWEKSRGCWMEHEAAIRYGIDIVDI